MNLSKRKSKFVYMSILIAGIEPRDNLIFDLFSNHPNLVTPPNSSPTRKVLGDPLGCKGVWKKKAALIFSTGNFSLWWICLLKHVRNSYCVFSLFRLEHILLCHLQYINKSFFGPFIQVHGPDELHGGDFILIWKMLRDYSGGGLENFWGHKGLANENTDIGQVTR